jgi:hypothetical protein
MNGFMHDVSRTIVQQPDFTGIGGHGPETHGGHGLHRQLDIGIGPATVDIRIQLPEPDHYW